MPLPGFKTGHLFGHGVHAIAKNGATVPWIGGGLTSPAIHDAGLGITFMSWEAWTGVRSQLVTSLDHATGYFSAIEGMGVSPLVNDDHGTPGIVLDHQGHLHGFYGAHGNLGGNMRHSSTRWPWDGTPLPGSKWAVRAEVSGEYTYPRPIMVGSTMYLIMRGVDGGDDSNQPLTLRKTSALSDGVATWGSEEKLVDFGTDSRFYMGSALLNGTDIWIVACRSDGNDTTRKGVYLFILDTMDGSIRNYDGSTDTASGSLPINLTLANSDYRIFDHGSNRGDIPAACFDTSGDFHVVFLDGTGINFALKHVSVSSGVLSSPATIDTIKAATDVAGYVEATALVALAADEIELWYPEDEAEAWANGGNMTRRIRSAGGVWGAARTVLRARNKALARPTPVVNGIADARVAFCEIQQGSTDAMAGGLKIYLWGAKGFVRYRQAPATPPASAAAGVELAEDGDKELREDGNDELREEVV